MAVSSFQNSSFVLWTPVCSVSFWIHLLIFLNLSSLNNAYLFRSSNWIYFRTYIHDLHLYIKFCIFKFRLYIFQFVYTFRIITKYWDLLLYIYNLHLYIKICIYRFKFYIITSSLALHTSLLENKITFFFQNVQNCKHFIIKNYLNYRKLKRLILWGSWGQHS